MPSRFDVRFRTVLIAVTLFLATVSMTATPTRAATLDRGDGCATQDWFKNDSLLELAFDLADANGSGKMLAVLWELPHCDSCARLHEVNFQHEGTKAYIKKNFDVVVMNMRGGLEVTDFDGRRMPERILALKYRIGFTPTVVFFNASGIEVFRLAGYFDPFHYLGAFVFARTGGYADPETGGSFPLWTGKRKTLIEQAFASKP
ncbi:MAG: thioredoxin fold domain-containing protein [Alphaproteobacteria bacterium]|nr:thioredoxin fold domain-containing protein [Alphaproteobacteria bacterium]